MKQRNGRYCVLLIAVNDRYLSADIPRRTNGRQPSPVYACLEHAQSVPSARIVMHQYGFMVMMDFGPYFKDVAESS